MTRDEHKQAMTRLLGMANAEHQADFSELITTLSEDYETTLTNYENANTRISELTTEREKLRTANTNLLLKAGVVISEPTPGKDPTTDPEKPKIKISDLFNEKGELK